MCRPSVGLLAVKRGWAATVALPQKRMNSRAAGGFGFSRLSFLPIATSNFKWKHR